MRRAFAVALALVGCAAAPEPGGPSLVLQPCHVRGVDEETRCGVLEVPEDPDQPEGRQIPLRVVVLPAVSAAAAGDPLFLLAGGPGQASSEIIEGLLPALKRIRERRDLVFVDQRGTGASNGLDCPEDERDPLTRMGAPIDPEETRACLAEVQSKADLGFYGTRFAAEDLDAVAGALGYMTVNVFGGSYGSRLALEWARRHPERIRTLTLDGLTPPQEPILGGSVADARAAFEALASDCAAEPGCQQLDPAADLLALLGQAESTPIAVRITHPRSGLPLSIELSGDDLAGMVRALLYTPQLAALMPLALHDARQGDPAPLVAQAGLLGSGAVEGMSLGLTLTVLCAEDLPRLPARAEATSPSLDRIGASAQLIFEQLCADWPRAEVDPSFYEPVELSIPTLLLSGGLDPVTPPRLGELARQGLSNAVHGIAPGAGHGVVSLDCAPRLMRTLIEQGTVEGLEVQCLDDVGRPAFFSSKLGPSTEEASDAAD